MRIWKIILAFGLLALIVSCASGRWETVSYTHLTLPTKA